MANDWGVKQNDNSPALGGASGVILKDGDGTVIPLAGCTVVLNMKLRSTGEVKIDEGAATIVSAVAGTVKYEWQTGDTDTPGIYQIEWQITDGSGNVQTVPTNGYDLLEVYAEIA